MSLKYGLIAAGQGSRLVAEGITDPKPLVKVGGETLIGRLIRLFCENDAESVSIIINEEMTQVYDFLKSIKLSVPLNIVVKTTPDSFQSFCELQPFLQDDKSKICLTTVDPIFHDQELAAYVHHFMSDDVDDALMGVTDYIDDEKPLYVKTRNGDLRIIGYANESYPGCRYISGGIYCMNQQALSLLSTARQEGVKRMRGFQQYLVDAGLHVQAWPFTKIIDIDHAADIDKAQQFLSK